MEKIDKFSEFNEAKTINCEPNWKNLYAYFKHMEKTDPEAFNKAKKTMGGEWDKLVTIATKDDKKEDKK